ncbi:MAG: hypothetical protein IPJ61_10275 [Tessaracoccus sp.]|jgi:hypothetical protein|uniref:hypothetical protein n=1 Tax=Tessaracoccus sp. TaxID=1971211 RepID=UPI001EB9FF69|nr:hypothetical protein [Tessaracoccus sp.]MBK7821438.1 hypothetical protein [Tessaracoccus sp.]
MHTDNTELTDAQTQALVRRGIAKGRRMNTTRRAVSGVAALAVVGALSIGAFNVVNAVSPGNNIAPAAPPAPTAPQEAPPASEAPAGPIEQENLRKVEAEKVDPAQEDQNAKQGQDEQPPAPNMSTSKKLKAAVKELLPDARFEFADGGTETDHAAILKIPSDDGYATVDLFLFDGGGYDLDGPGMVQVGKKNVWYFAGSLDDKQGKHDWYYQREDGAQINFYLSTIKRSGEDGKKITSTTSTLPLGQDEIAKLLSSPVWDDVLDEMMASR